MNNRSFNNALTALLLAGITSTLAGCSPDNVQQKIAANWVKFAPEYDAMTLQTYQNASYALDQRLVAMESAVIEAANAPSDKKPAIIVDIDETILNNVAVQERFAQNGGYSRQVMEDWYREANAKAVDGALDFLKQAIEKDVTVFYITNRHVTFESDTRRNLEKLGFPLMEDEDTLLMKYEKIEWVNKSARRKLVADKYQVVMMIGDNLKDFINIDSLNKAERDMLVTKYQNYWGTKWFMLPNPIYGSWQQLVSD